LIFHDGVYYEATRWHIQIGSAAIFICTWYSYATCMNYKYRSEKIIGVILIVDKDKSINDNEEWDESSWSRCWSLHREWLCTCTSIQIYSACWNERIHQRWWYGGIHHTCISLSLFDIDRYFSCGIPSMYVTFTSSHIEEHCTGLQMLSLQDCSEITETGLITISEHFNN